MKYVELRRQIVDSLARNDLDNVVQAACRERIEFYQGRFLFPSPILYSAISTAVGVNEYTLPREIMKIHKIQYLYASSWIELMPMTYSEILQVDTNQPSIRTVPGFWAPFGAKIRIFSTPDGVYPLRILCDSKIPAPNLDADENFWTVEAAGLIKHSAIAQIREERLKDPEGAMSSKTVADMELSSLITVSTLRESQGQLAAW